MVRGDSLGSKAVFEDLAGLVRYQFVDYVRQEDRQQVRLKEHAFSIVPAEAPRLTSLLHSTLLLRL